MSNISEKRSIISFNSSKFRSKSNTRKLQSVIIAGGLSVTRDEVVFLYQRFLSVSKNEKEI